MKRLHFDYNMRIMYTGEAQKCYYTLKCIPASSDRQHLEDIQIEIEPANTWSRGKDSFGNEMVYGSIEKEHSAFAFHISGIVTAGLCGCESAKGDMGNLGLYRYPHGLTVPGEGLLSYFHSIELKEDASNYEKSVALMDRLYQDFIYEKNVTDITTTAEEAWQLGRGVCQDYAHILIVLCRLAKIPARYVSGMLIGEGYSHAWVEIFSDGNWYALDPTNHLIVEDSHIKIGVGRNASDCVINRGIMIGGGSQTQEISVCVKEAEEGQEL